MKTSDLRIVARGEEYPRADRCDLYKIRVRVGRIKLGCIDYGGESEAIESAQAIANDLGHPVDLQFASGGDWQKFDPEGVVTR